MNKFLSMSLLTASLSASALAGLEGGLELGTAIQFPHAKLTFGSSSYQQTRDSYGSKQLFPYGISLGYSTSINGDPLRLRLSYNIINAREDMISTENQGGNVSTETITSKTRDQTSLFAYYLSPISSQFDYTIGAGAAYRRMQMDASFDNIISSDVGSQTVSSSQRIGRRTVWGAAIDAGIQGRFGQHIIISPTIRYTQFGRVQLEKTLYSDDGNPKGSGVGSLRPKEFSTSISLIYSL